MFTESVAFNSPRKVMPIKVVVFEDNHLLREGLFYLIHASENFVCTGAFPDCNDLLFKVKQSDPDIILMDIDMPGMNGLEALKIIKQNFPSIKVIMQTVFEDDDKIFEAILNGASGYLIKKTTPSRLLEAIEEVYNGGATMTPAIAHKALELFRKGVHVSSSKELEQLNERQNEILELIVKGQNFQTIADKLFITKNTVRYHVKNIYEILQVNSKSALVAKALQK
ncbi:MAG: response regulator transcription factor [Bacteroidia bacterium]